MKISHVILLACVVTFTACKKHDFKGANYCFKRSVGDNMKSANIQSFKPEKITGLKMSNDGGYMGPKKAIVACSKVIFPSKADAQKLFDENPNSQETQEIVITHEKLQEFLPNAIVAYNESTENPKAISIDDNQVSYLDTINIGDDERFWGMILQTVYYEFEMEDFRIRWYTNDCGTYKAKDVIIKRNRDTNWKFIYNKVKVDQNNPIYNKYSIHLSDTRCNNLYFWKKGDAGNPTVNDTLTHIGIRFTEDWNNETALGGREPRLATFGKLSTEEAGGGFGRVAKDIVGFSISVIYQLSDPGASGTYGLMYNFTTAEANKMKFSDIDKETSLAKQLLPIKAIEFDVQYDFAD